jgi:hypothetical protein
MGLGIAGNCVVWSKRTQIENCVFTKRFAVPHGLSNKAIYMVIFRVEAA